MNPALAELALRHLLLRLRPLHRALAAAVARRDRLSDELTAAGARAECITRGHVDVVLARLAAPADHASFAAGAPASVDDERATERALIDAAIGVGGRLPLIALADDLELSPFEVEVVVLLAAAELDPGFLTVFAFLHGDATRAAPSIELVCTLTATSVAERVARRQLVADHARLRRLGVVVATAGRAGLAQELALTPGALQFLLDGDGDARGRFHDPADVAIDLDATAPPGLDGGVFLRVALALTRGDLGMVGVFGGREATRRDAVRALAARSGLPLRRLLVADAGAVDTAAALGALLWVDIDAFEDSHGPGQILLAALAAARVPLVISGVQPWRPTALLEVRSYTELAVAEPSAADRARLWREHVPELSAQHAGELATRFRFAGAEIRAAAGMARATAAALRNGHLVTTADCLDAAAAAIARPVSLRFGTLIDPRREPDELVLPPDDHARVLEIAAHHRHGDRVLGEWGFRHRLTGSGGVKALFAGEPGTGKTLAAEVVARLLGLPLLKIDLARIVSKWVGETEKNLDAAFREAEDGHAVLFFDEAEALFGARADVRTGSDRYANLEVSFLLQRLDAYSGVAILATNMRDKIDPAFMRRFHVVVGFRRPQLVERKRLWRIAFPEGAPLGADVDAAELDELARFDLTGAGIVGAAQGAAFLAAEEHAGAISMSHVIRGLARQFQREARILTKNELGRHAGLLERS